MVEGLDVAIGGEGCRMWAGWGKGRDGMGWMALIFFNQKKKKKQKKKKNIKFFLKSFS